jgi:YfiH family protein
MQKNIASNGVVYYSSEKLGVTHGFSTRLGGVSSYEHTSSLNLAFGRGDDDATVLENLSRFADAVGVIYKSVVSLPQVHSNNVIEVTVANIGAGYFRDDSTLPSGCDGYVCRERGVAIGVKTADCVPILMADRDSGVICALHAGWRGSVLDIAGRGVEKMTELGARQDKICAVIGPCIHACCYEVGVEVYSAALERDKALEECFTLTVPGKYKADLPALNRALLIRAGLDENNIELSELCTCCNTDLFYSHRASGGKRGTMLSVISLD